VFGLTLPLVLSEAGSKFGKSAGAPVWLNPDKTSPFNFYQEQSRYPLDQLLTGVFHLRK
jgi:tyrosyl-tRNA synthetase